MTFASYTEHTRLTSKANCSVRLVYASLTSRECRETQAAGVLCRLREHPGFSGTEQYTVPQQPWTLT